MRSLTLIVTLLCCSLTVGCGSISQAKEMIGGLYGEVQAVKGEMKTLRAESEAVHGALDTDGDGEVTKGERLAFVTKVAKGAAMGNQEDKDRLTDWKFWLMIAVGGPAATGGVVAARNILKKKVLNPADSG